MYNMLYAQICKYFRSKHDYFTKYIKSHNLCLFWSDFATKLIMKNFYFHFLNFVIRDNRLVIFNYITVTSRLG